MAQKKAKKANMQLLLKTEESLYTLKSFLGFIVIKNLETYKTIKIYFAFFEIFYQNLLLMLDFLLGNIENENEMSIIISQNMELKWVPCQNNDNRSLKIVSNFDFVINFTLPSFLNFLQAFSLAILPSLSLKENEKLALQYSFDNEVYWNILKNIKNETEILKIFSNIKKDYNLNFDIVNLLLIFKYYHSLFILIYNSKTLILISSESTQNATS